MLALVIVAAVIGPPALGLGPRVSGTAARKPVPGPPTIGDCLTEPLAEGSVPASVAIPVPAVRYGPCGDGTAAGGTGGGRRLNYGEILSVTDGVDTFTSSRQSVPAGVLGAYSTDSCQQPLRDYLAWSADPWAPVLGDSTALVGPDVAQHLLGQRWIACVVTAGSHGYPGSVRDGPGRAADLYGQCEDTREALGPRVPCDDPHDTEVFGVALVDADGLSGLADSCLTLVTARTGMTDPAAGGRLVVRAGPFDPNTVPPDVSAGGQSMTCAVRVVGDGLLDASLVGVGDRPLPWA